MYRPVTRISLNLKEMARVHKLLKAQAKVFWVLKESFKQQVKDDCRKHNRHYRGLIDWPEKLLVWRKQHKKELFRLAKRLIQECGLLCPRAARSIRVASKMRRKISP